MPRVQGERSFMIPFDIGDIVTVGPFSDRHWVIERIEGDYCDVYTYCPKFVSGRVHRELLFAVFGSDNLKTTFGQLAGGGRKGP